MSKVIISTESTADLPYDYLNSLGIRVIFYGYEVGGKIYEDNMERSEEQLAEFYDFIAKDIIPSTSQINPMKYEEYLEELLQEGDVVHLAMGTGFSASFQNAYNAAEELKERYPERKIHVINSLCGSVGLGMLSVDAAEKRDAGWDCDAIASWAESVKRNYHHEFTSQDLKYYMRTGRLSGPTAVLGSLLNILPSMHLDGESKLIAYGREHGKKKAFRHMADEMAAHAEGGLDYSGVCYVAGANCDADANAMADMIRERFPKCTTKIGRIGTIIASHCGPGTVAVFYTGDPRP